jgi:hypothetical protein
MYVTVLDDQTMTRRRTVQPYKQSRSQIHAGSICGVNHWHVHVQARTPVSISTEQRESDVSDSDQERQFLQVLYASSMALSSSVQKP